MKTALVTGASSGIGWELAWVFAERGYDLVIVARNTQRLDALAEQLRWRYKVAVTVIPKDLAEPTAADELMAALTRQHLTIDVLVNNAGIGLYGAFARGEWETQRRLLQLNMVTPTHLTKLLLPSMMARRSGKILNVASTAAFQPGPLMALYYASKAYVLSFSEAIANELRGSGVTVTVLCPGPTTTEFQQRTGIAHTRLMSGRIMDAKRVAQAGVEALMRGQPLAIPGVQNRLLVWLVRLTPRAVVTRAVRHIQEGRR